MSMTGSTRRCRQRAVRRHRARCACPVGSLRIAVVRVLFAECVDEARSGRVAVGESHVTREVSHKRLEVDGVVEAIEVRSVVQELVEVDLYLAVELAVRLHRRRKSSASSE